MDVKHVLADNVEMNPASFKYYLEDCGSKNEMAGSSSCTFKQIDEANSRIFPVGISRIKLDGADLAGNTHSCIRTVLVYDWRPPEFGPEFAEDGELTMDMPDNACSFRPSAIFGRYEELNKELQASVVDNCDETVTITKKIYGADGALLYTGGHSSSRDPELGPGEYTMVYTAVDDYSATINYAISEANGSVSDFSPPPGTDALYHRSSHNVKVHLKDLTQPSKITACPSDITVSIGVGETSANVSWEPPTVSADNCLGSIGAPDAVELSNPPKSPGMLFPVGVHRVRYRNRDAAGNEYPWGCEFNIRVTSHPIVLSCPADVAATTLPRRNFTLVNWADPVVRQGETQVDASKIKISYPQGVSSGMPFPFGSTRVTVRATLSDADASHALVDECSFTVTVGDLEAPEPCAEKDRLCDEEDKGLVAPYEICDGPELSIALNDDWPNVFDYETLGVSNHGPRACCRSLSGKKHGCRAMKNSASKYCSPVA